MELKAVREIAPEHKAQLVNYLKITGMELGLLVNFAAYPNVDIVRMAGSKLKRVEPFGDGP